MAIEERKKFAVIGLGRFGLKLVEELSQMGLEVIAIDKDSTRAEKVKEIASETLVLDATDREALEKSGIKEVDAVIVSPGDGMERSVLITTLLKEMGVKEIICRAEDPLHAKILKRIGAHRVVFPEEDTAIRLAHTIHFPGIREYVSLKGPWHLVEFRVLPESKLIGRKIGEIRKEFKEGVNILMIEKEKEKEKEKERIIPRYDYEVKVRDILILFGSPENLEKFIKKIAKPFK